MRIVDYRAASVVRFPAGCRSEDNRISEDVVLAGRVDNCGVGGLVA